MARPVTAARRYAEAAFELAVRDDLLDQWRDDLAQAARVVAAPELERVLADPAQAAADRQAIVAQLLEGRVSPSVARLVGVLVERGRIALLPRVASEFARLVNRQRGIVTAIVTSAAPLTPDETTAIRSRVETMAGSAVELRTEVDPGLLGGLTVQVGDRLLDASVRGRLERLRDELLAGTRAR